MNDSCKTASGLGEVPPLTRDELLSLLSMLSHELCRPLASLRSGFDLLLVDSLNPISPEQRDHVRTMVSLCDGLLHLSRSYLDFSALVDSGRKPCLGLYALGALIREVERYSTPAAISAELELSCKVNEPSLIVSMDVSRFQQIVQNLVSNAIKYTPAGGRVSVEARVQGQSWVLVVEDSGLGIPVDMAPKIFDPFYRLPRDEHSQTGGTGLGLTICEELTSQLLGSLKIDPGGEGGTRVTVTFPVTHPQME